MRELPSRTVTFLFTDVEGSTKLLHELGPERYAHALAEHRRVMREAFGRHGGVEMERAGTEAVFEDVIDEVLAPAGGARAA